MADATPPHPAALEPDALLRQCHIRRTRGSGPGGQHRNKTETAIELTHHPTGVTAQASERRSQIENRQRALRRLRLNLALQVRRAPHAELAAFEPSALWRSRCRAGRVAVNPRHEDFPTLLAEALDAVAAWAYDVPRAAEALGVSTSQLVKFLKTEPAAHAHVNTERQRRGLKPMR